jgi:hypothetical protein
MAENDGTTIWISRHTKERMDAVGKFQESYDELLNRILDIFEIKKIDELTK